jgi:hypothetical protein
MKWIITIVGNDVVRTTIQVNGDTIYAALLKAEQVKSNLEKSTIEQLQIAAIERI